MNRKEGDVRSDGWAKHALDFDKSQMLSAIERGFPVSLISTPADELVVCHENDRIKNISADAKYNEFDYIPVLRDGNVLGLFDRAKLCNSVELDGHEIEVGKVMDQISESNIIAASAGILSFVSTADIKPCRFIVDCDRISGMVTISDLQRLPVRPVLFLLITHVELLMAAQIRRTLKESDRWLKMLSSARAERVSEKWARIQKENLALDKLSATDFCDKREIIVKAENFGISKGKARAELGEIEGLRNELAHSGDCAGTMESARRTVKRVRLAQDWVNRLVEISNS